MSSMAKIFVVVNLAFGIIAFGSAATLLGAQDDYKKAYLEEIAAHKKDKADDQVIKDDLDLQKTQQAQKASEERGRAETLQGQVEELRANLAAANTANDTLRAAVDSFSKELQAANQMNKSNQEFLQRLADDAKKATNDMLNAKSTLDKEIGNRVSLEQQVTELSDQVQTLAAEKGDVETRLRETDFWLTKYRERFGDIGMQSAGAPGQVMAVRGPLVSISVGSADKVKIGDWYAISRGPNYVGRIKITSVDKNLSVGQFDENNPGSGAPPQPGDRAAPSSE
jgi:predicted  nucleic acid-binding Zn-ribbon protein